MGHNKVGWGFGLLLVFLGFCVFFFFVFWSKTTEGFEIQNELCCTEPRGEEEEESRVALRLFRLEPLCCFPVFGLYDRPRPSSLSSSSSSHGGGGRSSGPCPPPLRLCPFSSFW